MKLPRKLLTFLLLGLLGTGCSAGRRIKGTEEPSPLAGKSIPVAEKAEGIYEVVAEMEAELLCIPPEEISIVATNFAEIEGDLEICSINLFGLKQELEIVKGSKWAKIQNYLTFLAIGGLLGAWAAN